jgi:2-polyprenyl-3-methyl-5-hydroxy-6-metoxy-1,4-benzoquinol methylase
MRSTEGGLTDMTQVTTGIRAVLSYPWVYNALQRVMGAKKGRIRNVREHVRPFPGMRILDLGCGTAEILNALPDYVCYVGYDMSSQYIAAAREKFGGRGTFHCRLLEEAEVTTLEPFDLVLGTGVLHHLDDDTARRFMVLAAAALKPGGRIYTVDPCFAPGQNPIARFLISRDRGQHVRDAQAYRALAPSLAANVKGTLVHRAWIPYTHWHMECQLPEVRMRLESDDIAAAKMDGVQ